MEQILEVRCRWTAFSRAGSSPDPAGNHCVQALEERAPLLRIPKEYVKELQRVDVDHATDIDDMPQFETKPTTEQAPQIRSAALLQEMSFDLPPAHP